MIAGWPSVVASCWMGVGYWYCLSLSVYGVSSGIHWGACVAEGIGGRCCRWLWCVVSSSTSSSPGMWLVFWCLACVSARPLPYVWPWDSCLTMCSGSSGCMPLKAIHSPNACVVRPDSSALRMGSSVRRFVR